MADTVAYRPKTSEIPTEPGVYRFRDATKRVLYVGKAKNLRARLSNYFQPLRNLHDRTRRMVTTAASVEWTVVANEFEALQLEYTWIKEFNPPFNVQFRDDKTYPYLAVTLADDIPRAMVTRNRKIAGARYFGPYTKVWAIRETLDLMLKAFPMRSCSDGVYRRAELTGRPCLLGDIGKCVAPCVGRVTQEEHREVADDFVSFMAGNDTSYIRALEQRMRDSAGQQEYEAAARYRDSIQAMRAVMEKTAVVFSEDVDVDVFGIADDELAAAVQQFIVRGGRIRGTRSWVVDKELDVEVAELIETVLENAYDGEFAPPREILVPVLPDDAAELELWLGGRRAEDAESRRTRGIAPSKVRLHVAQRGEKAALAQTAETNAKNALMLYKTRRSADFVTRSQALEDIRDALGMTEAPLRMECYDVSHLSGTNIVASMVVFEDGLPRKDQYRRFSIPASTDDTESIYQVLTRRLAYLRPDGRDGSFDDELDTAAALVSVENAGENAAVGESAEAEQAESDLPEVGRRPRKFSYPPQLLLVDGGQPQVAAARRALEESGVTGIQLAGIAKRLEELWLPDSDFPVILPRNSDALFLVQRIRDEAHRFAITYQRAKRRRDISSTLADIPGLGPARVRELLKHFGSVARLRQATPELIAEVKGIGPTLAATIHSTLHTETENTASRPESPHAQVVSDESAVAERTASSR
ncbi:excinuclease ABC subunit UvrC [Planctomonas sp. JC2975]|uniref:excinuclease ABC subunit UvrC n=1 Tax=Planctomonas sp. JC2975 TaxID=2729626 RepID=UPI001474A138|nr:excinuclease ABC subunit UvrC [Planctomonas sp. JC2975]NNC10519.1 excinuclease ABC subunit UvrC [Planctomonas sp. JC2975]